MRVGVPVIERGSVGAWLRLDTRTAIEKAGSDLAFDVRDVAYDAEAAFVLETTAGPDVVLAVGQLGRRDVDAPGSAFVRWAGAALESRGFRRTDAEGLSWRASAAAVLGERSVEADGRVTAGARWLRRVGRVLVGAEASADALLDGGSVRADLAVGPRLDLALAGDRRVSFHARWMRGRSPLGTGVTGVAVGFDFAEAPGAAGRAAPPDVGGAVALGAGGDRVARRLAVRILTPPLAPRWHAVLDVDGNVLTGSGVDELYYLYHVGVEREGTARAGVYFHHRSNHVLDRSDQPVTSLNVLEAGVESPGYDRPAAGAGDRRPWGRLEYRFRAGAVLDATIEGSEGWHARAGLMWTTFRDSDRVAPIARAEAEAGRGDRCAFSLGVLVSPGVEIRLERRRDDQYRGRDRAASLLLAALTF